jgi:5-formyltetrahydrofolate cyclo-ligase
MNKSTLRKTYLEKRKTLSQQQYRMRNHLLLERVRNFEPVGRADHIHVFLTMQHQKEPDTLGIIDFARSRHIRVIIPRMNGGYLEHVELGEQTVMKGNSFGIKEPENGKLVAADEIDLVFVPMILCDKSGNRIGYGKGYYDMFLAQATNSLKIGLSLAPPLDKIMFAEAHDVPLDYCITPFAVYDFTSRGVSSNNFSK